MVMHHTNERICHHPNKKAWIKLTGPAAGPLAGVFLGSTVVVKPEVMVEGQGEKDVKAHKKDKADSRRTVREHSVNVGVYTTLVTTPQGAEGMKPQTMAASKIIIKRTDGAMEKCVKVLRAYRIVLLGETGSGKSTVGNTIFGEDAFKTVMTTKYHIHSKSCHERRITVLDTPGFSNTDQPEVELKDEIARCTTRCTPGPHVFLIVLKVEKSTQKQQAVIDKVCLGFPEEAFKYTAIVFTHVNNLPKTVKIEQYIIENQGLTDLVMKCRGRYYIVDRKYSPEDDKNNFQVSQMFNIIDNIVRDNNGGCFTNSMLQAHKRGKDETKSGNPMQSKDNRANTCNGLWINFSGPEGNMLAEAFFGLPIAVWQKCPNTESKQECSPATSKQEEYDVTDSEPNVTAEENNTMSASKGKSTSTEWKKAAKEGNGTATEFKTDKSEAQEDVSKAVNQDTGGSGINLGKAQRATEPNETPKVAKRQEEGSGFMRNIFGMILGGVAGAAAAKSVLTPVAAGLGGVAMGGVAVGGVAKGVAEAIRITGAESVATDVGSAAGAESAATDVGSAAGAESTAGAESAAESSTISAGGAVKKALFIGSVTAAVGAGAWLKKKIQELINLYRMIKDNIAIVLLVVAFYFLLFLSFCARVPMVGTVLLSSGILLFLVIVLLLIASMK